MNYEEIQEYSKLELVDIIETLRAQLRDATDLLNDCGYELIDGVWRDMEYYPDDLE